MNSECAKTKAKRKEMTGYSFFLLVQEKRCHEERIGGDSNWDNDCERNSERDKGSKESKESYAKKKIGARVE